MEGLIDDEAQRRCAPEDRTADPHTCPFKVDMNTDYTTLCTCGPAQQDECSADI